jgi:seryl-tRNA synthetase
VRDALDPDHWVNGGECDHPHPDALAMEALDAENKQLRAEVERLRAENTLLLGQRERAMQAALWLRAYKQISKQFKAAEAELEALEKEVQG